MKTIIIFILATISLSVVAQVSDSVNVKADTIIYSNLWDKESIRVSEKLFPASFDSTVILTRKKGDNFYYSNSGFFLNTVDKKQPIKNKKNN